MQFKTYEKTSLGTLAQGAASHLFDEAMTKVLENVEDINTEAKKPRKITLEFVLTPDKDRENMETSVSVKTSLVPTKATFTKLQVTRDKGKLAAFEAHTQQAPDNVAEGRF